MATQAQTNAEIREWLKTAPGRAMNPDGWYGYQCQDVANQFSIDLFGADHIAGVVGARESMEAANQDYFEVIWNDANRHDMIPRMGDVIIWNGSASNRFGHIAVVMEATQQGVIVVQQDGFAEPHQFVNGNWYSAKPAHVATLGYVNPGTGPVRGWLRPRPEKVRYTGADKRGFADPVVSRPPAPSVPVTPNDIMHGVDIASWQKGIDLAQVNADFAIIKASGGVDYVNPELADQVASARRAGKLIGFYHYARENGVKNAAVPEAEHFLRTVKPYLGADVNLVLDWENEAVIGSGGNVWARDFLNHVRKATGKLPWLYSYMNALEKHQWATVSKTYPLWLAWYGSNNQMNGYASDFTLRFNVPHGFKLVAWQYSQHGRLAGYGGDIDLNVFFGDHKAWKAAAAGSMPEVTTPGKTEPQSAITTPQSTPTAKSEPKVHVVKPGEYLSAIAKMYGTTPEVLVSLNRYITNPEYLAVGDRITLPGAGAPTVTQAIVEPGDTLEGIAAQFGVTVARLKAVNPQIDPNYIQVGWVLNL